MAAPVDPFLLTLVMVTFGVFLLSFVLRLFHMPSVIAYILTGIAIGPFGFNLINNSGIVHALGELGIIFLLFFIGMEISLKRILENWKIALIGTLMQVVISVLVMSILGFFLDWPLGRVLLLGFVISISSTAVILKLLESKSELSTRTGQNVLSILLVQDIIIIPMIVVMGFFGTEGTSLSQLGLQVIGGLILVGVLAWVVKQGKVHLPLPEGMKKDHEGQIFLALVLCFAFSILSAFFGLSMALGAFVAGIVIASAEETQWVHKSLHSFYVVFVAVFFLSIGLLLDLNFIKEYLVLILSLVVIVFTLNFIINFAILIGLGENPKDSIYAAVLLSQIGEFSFILAAVGFADGMISTFGYSLILSVISLTLVFTPFLILLTRKVIYHHF